MGKHRTNRKVVTGNRKDQQQALKRTWRILDPLTKKGGAYLPAEDELRAWNKMRLADPSFGVEPIIKIDPADEAKARGLFGSRARSFIQGFCHDHTGKHGLGRRRKTRKEE